jgi:hypothetical protein
MPDIQPLVTPPMDSYDVVLYVWPTIAAGAQVVLLGQLLQTLSPERLDELKEWCEESLTGWGREWD